MNLNWSKIVIGVLISFVIFITTLGIWMALSPQSLYDNDYYERGENHAIQMQKEISGKDIILDLNVESLKLKVIFKKSGYVKSARLICLSDKSRDKEIKVNDTTLKSSVFINLGNLHNGLWIIEIYGQSDNKPFYKSQEFML